MDKLRLLDRRSIALGLAFCALSAVCRAAPDGPVRGFAVDMPLSLVVRQVVPSEVPVVFGAGVDPRKPASWRGGPSWQTALKEALVPLDLTATFEDSRVRIDTPSPPAPPPPVWLRPARWEALPGNGLADVIRQWSARIGVTAVVHGIYRYPVESRVVFEEDFQSAVSHLVESFSTAEPRPLLHIWSDGDNYTIELVQGETQ
jgi:hypothetical protein